MTVRRSRLLVAWKVVLGRGRRRVMILALFAVPVLIAATGAGVLQSVNRAAGQRAHAELAGADARVELLPPDSRSGAGESPPTDSETIDRLLATAGPGSVAHRVDSAMELPLYLDGRTVPVRYREADWTSPVLRTWFTVDPRGQLPVTAGEVAVSREFARLHHLSVGDHLRYRWSDRPAVVTAIVREPMAHKGESVLAAPGQLAAWSDGTHDAERRVQSSWLLTLPNPAPELATSAAELGIRLRSRENIRASGSLVDREPGLVLLPGLLLVAVGAAAAFGVRVRRLRREFSLLSAVGLGPRWILAACRLAGLIASATGAAVGLTLGFALSVALRPLLLATVERDLAPLTVPWRGSLLLLALTAAVGTAAVWAPARAAVSHHAGRQLASHPARSGRARLVRNLLAATGTAALATASVLSSGSAASVSGLLGCTGLCVALLMASPALLRLLARAARDGSVATRIALRNLAREPRRPVAALSVGFFSVTVAAATLVLLSSATADQQRRYVGSRHPGQIEIVLRHTGDVDTVRRVAEPALAPSGLTEVKSAVAAADRPGTDEPAGRAASPSAGTDSPSSGTTVDRPDPGRLSRPGWTVAEVSGDFRKDLQVIDSAAEFFALAGRRATDRELAVLAAGDLLALTSAVTADGRATLLPAPTEGSPPRGVQVRAVLSDPVDQTTLVRAGAVLSSGTALRLGAAVRVNTLITAPDAPPGGAAEQELVRVLEPLAIPATDLRFDRGPSYPPPVLLQILLHLSGFAVLASLTIALSASAQELRPDLRQLHEMGFHRGVQRRILALQSLVIAGFATLAGGGAGIALATARLRPLDVQVTVDWPALAAALGTTVLLAALLGAALAPRASRLRNT
ncbi:FtsX-like permease family protein [Kitasatospora sp. NPDC096147]|uniref:FtsX-like permease family protein n=1 Tax=Kitasatospora sp. NPDC096147 TaxID=3364093 RepID=UPI0037FFBAAC